MRGVPPKVTFQYITSVGFKSKNDRAILTVLKFIKFADSSGVPHEAWGAYRVKSESPKVLAGALKTAYKTLFDTYPDANRKDNEALRNFFSGHIVAENTVALMVRTFKAMADMGNFDSPAALPDARSGEVPELEVEEKAGATRSSETEGGRRYSKRDDGEHQHSASDPSHG